MKKKSITTLLAVSVLLSCYGCNDKKAETVHKVDVWTAASTEKLMRDVDYSARYGEDTLTIKAFKNEYESAQIVVSSEGNYTYEVTPSALKNGNGDVLSADAFELYHEKYINVSKKRDENSPTPVGYYPDALLPLEKAVEYGENVLTGKNQGIWVTLKVPKEQPSGTYTGEFTVKVNGRTEKVPVNVTVYDYTLSDEVHSKSSFAVGYEYLGWGELDTSVEMQEAYYEALLEYRLNGQNLPGNELIYVRPEGEELERFLYYADKYTKDPRCSSFNLPFTMTTAVYDGAENKSVDFELFAVLLREMAKYSVENNVNLFEKASTYFIFFDEYDLNGSTHVANYNLNKAVEVCEAVATELADTLTCNDAGFLQTVLSDLAGIKHKVVGNLTDGLQVEKAVSVPLISKYHSQEGRDRYTQFAEDCYGEDAEMWAYTCLEPRTPHPTYHIEDILLSSRLMGWMMYDYDIVGNLYWETALYTWRESAFGDYQLQDYYDTAMRYPATNGDGFLFYPGRDYGVYGPIGTVRLHSIRDGNEDYDLMYALEEMYAQYGVNEEAFDRLYDLLTQKLYAGTMVRIRDGLGDYFAQSREQLAQLLEVASNTGTAIADIQASEGNTVVTLTAPADVTLKRDGKALTPVATGERNEYKLTVEMTQEQNYLDVTATKGDKTYALQLNLGGRSQAFNGAALLEKAKVHTGGEVTADEIDSEQVLKISYDDVADEEKDLRADLDVSSWGVDENVGTVVLNVYSYGEEAVTLEIYSSCENSDSYIASESVALEQGWNKISIPVTAFNCSNYGKLVSLRLYIKAPNQATQIALGKIEIGG